MARLGGLMKSEWVQILEGYLTSGNDPVSAKFSFVQIFPFHNISLPFNFMGAVDKCLLPMEWRFADNKSCLASLILLSAKEVIKTI
tara:strand:+ start:136 stop:393 length:258 start_codon:yes stop_codon:yes gene_type:complete